MASYNRVILLGNLTRDVQSRSLQGGTVIADFGLAINHKFKTANRIVATLAAGQLAHEIFL